MEQTVCVAPRSGGLSLSPLACDWQIKSDSIFKANFDGSGSASEREQAITERTKRDNLADQF